MSLRDHLAVRSDFRPLQHSWLECNWGGISHHALIVNECAIMAYSSGRDTGSALRIHPALTGFQIMGQEFGAWRRVSHDFLQEDSRSFFLFKVCGVVDGAHTVQCPWA